MAVQEASLEELRQVRHPEGEGTGNGEFGGGQAGDGGQGVEQTLQGVVLAAQDVGATDSAAFESQDLAQGQVVDMGHVQDGVDVAGDATVQVVEDELSRRCRCPVAGSEGEGGEDDADGEAFGRGSEHLVLGDVLGLFVGAEEVADIGEGPLV